MSDRTLAGHEVAGRAPSALSSFLFFGTGPGLRIRPPGCETQQRPQAPNGACPKRARRGGGHAHAPQPIRSQQPAANFASRARRGCTQETWGNKYSNYDRYIAALYWAVQSMTSTSRPPTRASRTTPPCTLGASYGTQRSTGYSLV